MPRDLDLMTVNSADTATSIPLEWIDIPADGKTDVTRALQAALDAKAGRGGTLYLPPGEYLLGGSVTIPTGVTLQGAASSPQFHARTGTVILATHGRGNEEDPLQESDLPPALFEMGESTCVRGLTIFYPEQDLTQIVPYSWTFHLYGADNTIENVTLIHAYNAIRVGPENNVRHRIRSVYGTVLRRGIFVDFCTDVGRIDNVEFHYHWSWATDPALSEGLRQYLLENLEFCTLGRTDWEYVTNAFVFEARTGYRFIKTENGGPSAQMVGVGADSAHISVLVDGLDSWWTLLITNGQFSSDGIDDTAIGVLVNQHPDSSFNGPVRLVNCSILGQQSVVSHSPNLVSLQDCYFNTWGPVTERAQVTADNGRLQVTGCNFDSHHIAPRAQQTSIEIGGRVSYATVMGNVGASGVKVVNNGVAEDRVNLVANQPATF